MPFAKYVNKAYISPDRLIKAFARIVKEKDVSQDGNGMEPKLLVSKDGVVTINKRNPDVIKDFEHNIKVLSSK